MRHLPSHIFCVYKQIIFSVSRNLIRNCTWFRFRVIKMPNCGRSCCARARYIIIAPVRRAFFARTFESSPSSPYPSPALRGAAVFVYRKLSTPRIRRERELLSDCPSERRGASSSAVVSNNRRRAALSSVLLRGAYIL